MFNLNMCDRGNFFRERNMAGFVRFDQQFPESFMSQSPHTSSSVAPLYAAQVQAVTASVLATLEPLAVRETEEVLERRQGEVAMLMRPSVRASHSGTSDRERAAARGQCGWGLQRPELRIPGDLPATGHPPAYGYAGCVDDIPATGLSVAREQHDLIF